MLSVKLNILKNHVYIFKRQLLGTVPLGAKMI